jgi:hypothetical protein
MVTPLLTKYKILHIYPIKIKKIRAYLKLTHKVLKYGDFIDEGLNNIFENGIVFVDEVVVENFISLFATFYITTCYISHISNFYITAFYIYR